ncbi:MAG: hypothetical protein FIA94_14970 [Nitrospirae bacterium]|nr:hypothetical protein [Nitrospirota bacterium]
MHLSVFASIAVIAGKLIAGKSVASLYDFALPGNIDIDTLPNAPRLKAFHVDFRDYTPGVATGSSYQYMIDESGQVLDLTINGSSFIGHIKGGASYFIGNVRGDAIYIFDHASSSAINFRISGCMIDYGNKLKTCHACWPGK